MSNEETRDTRNGAENQDRASGGCCGTDMTEMMAKCCTAMKDNCGVKMKEMIEKMCAEFNSCDTQR